MCIWWGRKQQHPTPLTPTPPHLVQAYIFMAPHGHLLKASGESYNVAALPFYNLSFKNILGQVHSLRTLPRNGRFLGAGKGTVMEEVASLDASS